MTNDINNITNSNTTNNEPVNKARFLNPDGGRFDTQKHALCNQQPNDRSRGVLLQNLRFDALKRWTEYQIEKTRYDAFKEREDKVVRAVLADEPYYAREDYRLYEDDLPEDGRITDPNHTYLMSETDMYDRYLPALSVKWKELYGLVYPENYTPQSEFLLPYDRARTAYLNTAVDLFRIHGDDRIAEEMKEQLKGFVPNKFVVRIENALNEFLFGKLDSEEYTAYDKYTQIVLQDIASKGNR